VRAAPALLALALLLGACTGDDDSGPSPRPDSTSSTSLSDYSGVKLPGVGGETTTTIEEKGTARLVGSVTGPSGPVGGATVRIDRLVAGRVIRHDVLAGPDGRWELRDVPGGRYRVRAFQAPTYAQSGAEVRFLPDGEESTFDLKVEEQQGVVVRADVAPDQPLRGAPVNLVVLVVQRTVSPDGIIGTTPVGNAYVELSGLGRWVVRDDSSPSGATDSTDGSTTSTFEAASSEQGAVLSGDGRATFELRCVKAGAPGLKLRIPVLVAPQPAPTAPGSTTTEPAPTTEEVALELPACIDPHATTTTTATTPSSSAP
jgi:hypothetical protein